MGWGPSPSNPLIDAARGWFPAPPPPIDPVHELYWRQYQSLVLSGALHPLVAALVGAHGMEAVLSGSLRPLVASLVGEHSVDGQLATALQPLQFAGTNIITSDLTGALQPLRAALVGEHALTGVLSGALRPLSASLTGQHRVGGQLAGALHPLSAAMTGSTRVDGALAAPLRRLSASLVGGQSQTGTLAAALRALQFAGLGVHSQAGQLSGGLRPLSMSAEGSVRNAVVLDNTSDGGSGGVTTRSWSHTNTGNCIVVGFVNSTGAGATCTYGGVNIPRVYGPVTSGLVFPARGYYSVFALISGSLPTGSNTVSCTNAGTASSAGAITFKNAGSFASLITNNSNGAINETTSPGDGRAAVAAFGGGGVGFGSISPNEAMRYGFSAFVTWPNVIGYGFDTGSGVHFTASQSSSKAGAVVTILPP